MAQTEKRTVICGTDERLNRKPTYENTYWSDKGKHPEQQAALAKLIPVEGEVPNVNLHPALETFRIATNCYYDLYNNGLCNRGKEFHDTFGFDAFDVGEGRYFQRGHDRIEDYDGMVELTQELIDRTETRMDEIILAAYAEQFPPVAQQTFTLTLDYRSLREQKQWLLTQPGPFSDGLIALIDAIQDQAADVNKVPFREVFGKEFH